MNPDEELRLVRRREGTYRPASRENPGYDRDLLRDNDGNLLGPTESRPVNIDEFVRSHVPPRLTVAQQIVGQVVGYGMEALRPHIMHGVDVAVDAKLGVPKVWKWIKNKAEQRRAEALFQSPSASAQLEPVPAEATSEIDDEAGALGVHPPIVTAEQYEAALRSVHEAVHYAAHVRQLLANVVVSDGAESSSQAALEGSPPSIEEATFKRAVERLDSSRSIDVEFMFVRDQDAHS